MRKLDQDRHIEIRKLTIPSVMKATIYFLAIPIALFGIFTILGSIFILIAEGIVGLMGLPIFLLGVGLYGGIYLGITALITLIYNLFAGKFGGLVIKIRDIES